MIVATGVDLLAIDRLERLIDRGGERVLARLFTPRERDDCARRDRPAASLAARFCAKEAVMKCLGAGYLDGIAFRAIEVVRADHGAVTVTLHDAARGLAQRRGITRIHLSLSHIEHTAIAFAVAEG